MLMTNAYQNVLLMSVIFGLLHSEIKKKILRAVKETTVFQHYLQVWSNETIEQLITGTVLLAERLYCFR